MSRRVCVPCEGEHDPMKHELPADPTPTPEQHRTDEYRTLSTVSGRGLVAAYPALLDIVRNIEAEAQARPEQDEAVRLRNLCGCGHFHSGGHEDAGCNGRGVPCQDAHDWYEAVRACIPSEPHAECRYGNGPNIVTETWRCYHATPPPATTAALDLDPDSADGRAERMGLPPYDSQDAYLFGTGKPCTCGSKDGIHREGCAHVLTTSEASLEPLTIEELQQDGAQE